MDCSIAGVVQEYGATGILYDVGSVYEGLCKLSDIRKAKGKQYALEMVLLIVVMAKLCGEDKPLGIAEWAQHRHEELVQLLCLNWRRMPSHHTYRRILAYKVYVEEVERLVRGIQPGRRTWKGVCAGWQSGAGHAQEGRRRKRVFVECLRCGASQSNGASRSGT